MRKQDEKERDKSKIKIGEHIRRSEIIKIFLNNLSERLFER